MPNDIVIEQSAEPAAEPAALTEAAAANQKGVCSSTAVITGLVPGTTYWLDAMLKAVTGGTATLHNVSISAVEIGS